MYLKIVNMYGYFSIIVAIPVADNVAIIATPISSPVIIYIVLFNPIPIPILRAKNIHIPGVIETKKNVGIKTISRDMLM